MSPEAVRERPSFDLKSAVNLLMGKKIMKASK